MGTGEGVETAGEPVKETEAAVTNNKEDEAVTKEKPKADSDEEKNKRKDTYVKDMKPHIDEAISEYDKIWNDLWIPTFTKLGSNEITQIDAYKNIKDAQAKYDALFSQINKIEVPKGLTKEDKENIKEFKNGMTTSAMLRGDATKEAAKMIDTMDFSPSTMTEIEDIVSRSDAQMLSAIAHITSLEHGYGVER
ncbi:hypothetical protein J2S17_002904 [Cytobacillus purgationiresistens]|uniref:Uncharacterized protein n=2 Tax=Cytobacillus purgationiresistens TaxID=863449 RepID=A0ABU0AID5_9BACI|nr:hypothetical protein [Cytobacillus purgationiresistens]